MHGAKCSHDPGATITTAPEEANNLMQLQQHSLQTQITGGQRHLQAEKVRPTKLRWMKWQKAVWRTVATEGPPTSARSFTLAAAFVFPKNLSKVWVCRNCICFAHLFLPAWRKRPKSIVFSWYKTCRLCCFCTELQK
jgi:hypothetical protein